MIIRSALAAAWILLAPSIGAWGIAGPAIAQDGVPFYQGKTIRIVISTGVAGGYMEYARALADNMGKYIPGRRRGT